MNTLPYIQDFVGPKLQARLIHEIDSQEWNTKLARRTQHYIHEYDYSSRNALEPTTSMPKYIKMIADHLLAENILESIDQVIVNEYTRKQGINAHIDKDIFGPTVAIVTLNSSDEMIFRRVGHEPIIHTLEPGSLAILEGELRYKWTHEIKSLVGKRSKDFRRISITYRSIS